MIHLAIADLISSIITPVHFVYGMVAGNIWHFGPASCTIVSVIGPLTVNISAWILASIAYERYRGIVTPLKPRCTKFRIHMAVVVIWIASLFTLIPYMQSMELIGGRYCAPNWKDTYYEYGSAIGMLVLQSILPIAFMTFAVTRILKALKDRIQTSQTRESPSHINKTESSPWLIKRATMPPQLVVCEPNSSTAMHFDSSVESEDSRYLSHNKLNGAEESTFTNLEKKKSLDNVDILQKLSVPPRYCYERRRSFSDPSIDSSNDDIGNKNHLISQASNSHFGPQKNCRESNINNNKESQTRDLNSTCQLTITRNERCSSMPSGLALYTQINDKLEAKLTSSYKKYRERVRSFLSQESKTANSRNKKQRKTIVMLIVTFSVFMVCSLPYNIFYLVGVFLIDFQRDKSQLETLQHMNIWLSTLVVANSVMNCCIYAGMNLQFRSYCYSLFKLEIGKSKKDFISLEVRGQLLSKGKEIV